MKTLIEELREWETLPWFVDKNSALVTLLRRHREDPRIEALFLGKTSVQRLLGEVVTRNQSLQVLWKPRDIGVTFSDIRETCRVNLTGIIRLADYFPDGGTYRVVSLLEDHTLPRTLWVIATFVVVVFLSILCTFTINSLLGMVVFFVLDFVAYFGYVGSQSASISWRRELAQRVFDDAVFIDRCMTKARSLFLV